MRKIYVVGPEWGYSRTNRLIEVLNKRVDTFCYLDKPLRIYDNKIVKRIFSLINLPSVLFKVMRADIIIISAMNNDKILPLVLAMILNKITIVDYYLSFYDTRVIDRKQVSNRSIKAKLYNFYDSLMLKAKYVLFLNLSEAKMYLSYHKAPIGKKHKIVPLCIKQKPEGTLPYYNQTTSIFNVAWFGSYIPLHGLDKIIEAFNLLNDKSIHLSIFGNCDKKKEFYDSIINQKGLNEVVSVYTGFSFDNHQLTNYLVKKTDLILGVFGDSKKAKTVIPNKVIDAVSLKIPVLTAYSSGVNEYFNSSNIFLCENTPDKIAQSILEIRNNDLNKISKLVNSAYGVYDKKFSPEAFEKNIFNILDSLDESEK